MISEGAVQSVPEGAVQSVPEGAIQSVPEGAVQSVPEGAVQSVPGGAVQSVPEGYRISPSRLQWLICYRSKQKSERKYSPEGHVVILHSTQHFLHKSCTFPPKSITIRYLSTMKKITTFSNLPQNVCIIDVLLSLIFRKLKIKALDFLLRCYYS